MMIPIPIDNELELEAFVFDNIDTYFEKESCIFIGKKRMETTTGKITIPDGLILDIANECIVIIEVELIIHKVFDHIAKQIIQFLVAYENPDTKMKLRDFFLEEIRQITSLKELFPDTRELDIPKKIEKILKEPPKMYIFIDEYNDDLEALCYILRKSVDIAVIEVMKTTNDIDTKYIFNDPDIKYYSKDTLNSKGDSQENYSIEDHLKGKPMFILQLANNLRQTITGYNLDIYEYAKQEYIGYTHRQYENSQNKKIFCLLIIYQTKIKVYLRMTVENLKIVDPEGKLKEIPRSAQSGQKSWMEIKTDSDVEYVVKIIQFCYDHVFHQSSA